MKLGSQAISLSFTVICFFTATCFADNPIIQTNYTADPAPLVYNEMISTRPCLSMMTVRPICTGEIPNVAM